MYCGQIRYVDDQLGRIVQALEKLGISDNTIICFWSDHGELLGDHGTTHKLPCYYDSLTRVPALIYDPQDRIDSAVGEQLVETIDIMATLLDLVGLEQPEGSRARSLLSDAPERQDVFAEAGLYKMPPKVADPDLKIRAPLAPTHWGPGCMLRTREWKLCQYAHDQGELYDLTADPYEVNNLYGETAYLQIQMQLQERLSQRLMMQGQAPEYASD